MFLVDFFLSVKVFAVIKQLANRRISLGSDLHQIKLILLSNFQRFFQSFFSKLVIFRVNQADI
jgi:hypothetical protein